jgi:uncharacterized repeat protein (TIGR03803 family)
MEALPMTRRVFFFCGLALNLALFTFFTAGAAAQTETVIHAFQNSSSTDGAYPPTGVVADQKGALYGATSGGGLHNYGSIYKLSPPSGLGGAWTESILYSFTGGADSGSPMAIVLNEKQGKIYGATSCSCGSGVFELTPPAHSGSPWTESVIYSSPVGIYDLIADPKGGFYGSTLTGGTQGGGSVFLLSQSGGIWSAQTLFSFATIDGKSLEPGGLTIGPKGVLYGVTGYGGGKYYEGTVWTLTPPSGGRTTWTKSTLFAFPQDESVGAFPMGNLTFDSAGNIYGTTDFGGGVYQLVPPAAPAGSWTLNLLYTFQFGSDGGQPDAGVIFDSTGALYGTTTRGGDLSCGYYSAQAGCGTVYKLIPPLDQGPPWTEETLHEFSGGTDGVNETVNAGGPSLLLLNNNFYGTTEIGGNPNVCVDTGHGNYGCGTVYELTQ